MVSLSVMGGVWLAMNGREQLARERGVSHDDFLLALEQGYFAGTHIFDLSEERFG
ncbi:MAG TPA: hypothetical protein VKR27_03825 [Acidimicrobiales bacterium]|nr:hypothetical protein [Acidimicrobiales bacterium]